MTVGHKNTNDSVPQCTEVRFASLLSGGFITAIVVNPPERKLAKRTIVHCQGNINPESLRKMYSGTLKWHLCLRKRTDFGSSLSKFLKINNFLQKLTYVLNIF